MSDFMAEMLTGQKGAVKTICKLVTCRACSSIKNSTLILGLSVDDLNDEIPRGSPNDIEMSGKIIANSLEYQLWEGEIILLPRRKYRGRKSGREQLSGLMANQILTSNWGDTDAWLEKIFDIEAKQDKEIK